MDSYDIAKIAATVLDNRKGSDIKALHIAPISSVSDYFVLAKAGSLTQAKSMADEIDSILEKEGIEILGKEGYANDTGWVLLDFGGVMVHIFYGPEELYENLSRLWAEAEEVAVL